MLVSHGEGFKLTAPCQCWEMVENVSTFLQINSTRKGLTSCHELESLHDDIIKWKHFLRYWWIPHAKASDAELWCFLWSAPGRTVEPRMETLVIWDAIGLLITSLLCCCLWSGDDYSGHLVIGLMILWVNAGNLLLVVISARGVVVMITIILVRIKWKARTVFKNKYKL